MEIVVMAPGTSVTSPATSIAILENGGVVLETDTTAQGPALLLQGPMLLLWRSALSPENGATLPGTVAENSGRSQRVQEIAAVTPPFPYRTSGSTLSRCAFSAS